MQKKIFEATRIGNLELKNRLWRSATWLNQADEKGHLTSELITRYEELAKGGVGSIITGYAHVLEQEQPNAGMLGIYSDDFIEEYRPFVKRIHELGAKLIMQVCYGGSSTKFQTKGRLIWGPSAVQNPGYRVTPTRMKIADIKTVIDAYAQSARRVKEAGFDGVQIHAAHAYLYSQFLSPYFNRRTDAYGGSIENRARIIFETLEAVRQEVGPDYPVLIKMHSTDDWDANGLTPIESLWVAKELEKRGITAIEFSGGNRDFKYPLKKPIRAKILKREKQAYFFEATKQIAAELTVPVISVGGHRNFEFMEHILNDSNISYVSLSRTLFSEPDLPNKWMENPDYDPRCTSCSKCWSPEGNICILDRKKSVVHK
ncbi:NADH:flavin oxidoreductase [Ancylomarina sp. 16SWW S1-10-2]|uniref:NADH:flavin oxidoreductase n=1 Tax=Ancylomarina sp. 16SWW S1-10-2 TaxID=2499681 RepID=UPI0012ADB6CF|nr:NADH:flavin oxidoreductase [Ancylomarina sp. 16SWW S1-10-2]MRT92523.1 NADH:flavin oxidoreductase [Ancylomarina sp. 16SWW S1-10-2]